MVRLRTTAKSTMRVAKPATLIVLAVLLGLTTLTGCSFNALPGIRPHVNKSNNIALDPGTIVYDFDDSKQNIYSGEETPVEGWNIPAPIVPDRYWSGSVATTYKPVQPQQFAPTERTVVSCPDYAQYLQEHVCIPVQEILDKLPTANREHIYFKVLHAGYTYDSTRDRYIQASPFTYNSKGKSAVNVGGMSLPTFASVWMQTYGKNKTVAENSRKTALEKLESLETSGFNMDIDWLEGSKSTVIPSDIKVMWGNDRTGYRTLDDFYVGLKSNNLVGVVPNVNFVINKSKTSKASVVVNSTQGLGARARYVDCMSSSSVDNLFTAYNQSELRDAELIAGDMTDDNSIFNYWIDGYNKTMVLIGTDHSVKLDEMLGEYYSDVLSVFTNMHSVDEWQNIVAMYPTAVVIPTGVRGVD